LFKNYKRRGCPALPPPKEGVREGDLKVDAEK